MKCHTLNQYCIIIILLNHHYCIVSSLLHCILNIIDIIRMTHHRNFALLGMFFILGENDFWAASYRQVTHLLSVSYWSVGWVKVYGIVLFYVSKPFLMYILILLVSNRVFFFSLISYVVYHSILMRGGERRCLLSLSIVDYGIGWGESALFAFRRSRLSG